MGLILAFLLFFRLANSYHMPANYNYDSDFGRDLLAMEKINQGKFTLVGPQFSLAGLRLSPYHFYFFAPFLLIGQGDYRFVLYANAGLFLIGFLILYFFVQKKKGILFALLTIGWFATSPELILAARSPGNAFSYLMPLIIYSFYLLFIPKLTIKKSLLLGLFAGVFINYHPISLFSTIIPFLIATYFYKDDLKSKLLNLTAFSMCLLATFIPVFIFDLKHQFIIAKSIFSARAGEFFSKNQGSFLQDFFAGKMAIHYYLPIFILLQAIFLVIIRNIRYSFILIIILIAINLSHFPKNLYQPARNLRDTEIKFNQFIKKGYLPKNNFNVVLVNNTYLSAVGYEYRFLLTKNGFKPDDEYSYSQSNYLLVISEKGPEAINSFKSWEMEQFGKKELVKKFQKDNLLVFLYKKIN